MATNPWDILGLEPCQDKKRIRRGYAAKLKLTNPEDDPEGFKELRQAYEMVLAFLDIAQRQPELLQGVSTFEDEDELDLESDDSPSPSPPTSFVPEPTPLASYGKNTSSISGVLGRVRALCEVVRDDTDDDPAREWRIILEDDALWGLDARAAFERELFGLLAHTKPDLAPEVWLLLDQEFHWREQSLTLYRLDVSREEVDDVLERIHAAIEWRSLEHFRGRNLFTTFYDPDDPEPNELEADGEDWLSWLGDFFSEYAGASVVVLMIIGRLAMYAFTSAPDSSALSSADPIERLTAAAGLGNPGAAAELGDRYRSGDGVTKDVDRAIGFYRSAAQRGHTYAQRRLGDAYREGWVEMDMEKALEWYGLAADHEESVAEYWLGRMHLEGWGTPADEELGFSWMRKSALQSYAFAQVWVGLCYERGRGVEPDMRQAFMWYQRAGKAEDPWAQFALGRFYWSGTTVEPDEDEARFWMSLAARNPDLADDVDRWQAQLQDIDDERQRALDARLREWRAVH